MSDSLPTQIFELTVKYRTPSLNITKRSHWTKQYEEKKRAFRALRCALSDTVSDPSTLTTSLDRLRTCSTVFDTWALSQGMNLGEFVSKPSRKRSEPTKKRKQ